MADGIYAALTGAVAQSQALDVVANNLANADTTGFKRDQVTFRESLARARGDRVADPTARHVAVDQIRPDFRPGASHETGNPLDLSLETPGFFVLQTAQGERFTRAGAFRVQADGAVTSQDGDPVLGDGGPLQVDPRRPWRVDATGTLWSDERPVGRVRVVAFADPEGLVREARAQWRAPVGKRPSPVEASVRVGALERSNVNAVEAMTQLVWISRAYESFHRTIEVFRAVDSRTVTDLGR
ncbi:MAG: flagellar basal-body rod protein FlgF [Deltaproteobacteria bacterium]|nr:flagellar basal-body rod protein FlgF [Deltaproteobacteria bacterium]